MSATSVLQVTTVDFNFDIPRARYILGLPSGKIAYDIGARNGDSSLFLSQKFDRVMAFEPMESNFTWLRNNTQQNKKIKAVKCGFGTSKEPVIVTSSLDNRRELLSVCPLDMMAGDNQDFPPDLIKIDIDGSVLDVLESGKKTLETYRPALFIEYEDNSMSKVETFLNKFGYAESIGVERWHLYMKSIPVSWKARVLIRKFASSLKALGQT